MALSARRTRVCTVYRLYEKFHRTLCMKQILRYLPPPRVCIVQGEENLLTIAAFYVVHVYCTRAQCSSRGIFPHLLLVEPPFPPSLVEIPLARQHNGDA